MKRKNGKSVSRLYAANTALVLLIERADNDDLFGVEFAPYDEQGQSIDDLKFYPVTENGKQVTFNNQTVPFVYVTKAKAYYRIVNLGFDNTRACVSIIDSYEVAPYVHR